MNKNFSIFLIFSLLAMVAVAYSVWESPIISSERTGAEGFGVSPPYFKTSALIPGIEYKSILKIKRSAAKTPAKAKITIIAPGFENWLTIKPGNLIELEEGVLNSPFELTAIAPPDAKTGEYSGFINITMITDEDFSGVGIRTAVLAEIKLRVTNGQDKPLKKDDFEIANIALYEIYKGNFVNTASSGGFFYISPAVRRAHYFSGPDDVKKRIVELGKGMTNKNLEKIPVSLKDLTGKDTDQDGLPDNLESAIGTDTSLADTDGDLFPDAEEIKNGYSPTRRHEALPIDFGFARAQSGRIFLQVESRGEAWYVNPADNKKYFLGSLSDAFNLLDQLAIEISESDLNSLMQK